MKSIIFLILLFVLLNPQTKLRAGILPGVGVLGDSYSDEYQFYPPDRCTARNWVEILAETHRLDFGAFSTEPRDEPRNRGYAYNWARSFATSNEMIAQGQHTGLAEQVGQGLVQYVVILIGGNDFLLATCAADPVEALRASEVGAYENLRRALSPILGASDRVRALIATLPDIRDLPEVRDAIAAGTISSEAAVAAGESIWRYNRRIYALAAAEPRVAVIDLYLTTRIVGSVATTRVRIDGQELDRIHPDNNIDHFFLADGRHVGTVAQGMLARLIVEILDSRFQAGIPHLSDHEVMDFAREIASRPADVVRHPTAPRPQPASAIGGDRNSPARNRPGE